MSGEQGIIECLMSGEQGIIECLMSGLVVSVL